MSMRPLVTICRPFGLFLLILFICEPVFPDNQLRIDKFRWKTAETSDLRVFYYAPEDDLFDIKPVLDQIEYTHKGVTGLLDVEFPKKTPVFVYYDHTHFQQNRIAAAEEGVEGFSEAFKNRLVIPIRYSRYDLNHLIAHEYTHIAQFEILYGGFWKSAKLIKGLSGLEPLWVMEGQAEHVSHKVLNRSWSSYDRMILRDAVLYDYLYSLRQLQNFNALYRHVYLGYKEAHSAIDYLVETEGEEVNFRLLKSMRNNLDPTKAFEDAAEKFASYRDFDIKWQKKLREETDNFIGGKDRVEDVSDAVVENRYHSRNPVLTEKGDIVYVSDVWGPDEIYLDEKGHRRKLLHAFFGSRVKMLVTGRRYDRIISYSPAVGTLVFIADRDLKDIIYLCDLSGKIKKELEFDLHELRSPAISDDGRLIAFTALKDSKRNIYLYDLDKGLLTQLTDDGYIDYGPVISHDSREITVATERELNTDLRRIDIQTKKYVWLTETPCDEIHPYYAGEKKLVYSADKNSVFNLYMLDPGKKMEALTDIAEGLFFPCAAEDGNIYSSAYYDGSYKIVRLKGGERRADIAATRNYIKEDPVPELASDQFRKGRYRFNFSTDFFLPSLLYSTDIGFVGGGYYRASDLLAHHTVDFYGWAWPGTYTLSTQYTLRKWRPDVFLMLGTEGEKYRTIEDDDETEKHKNYSHEAVLGYTYPLTSFTSFSNWYTAGSEDENNLTTDESVHETETGVGLGITRSTAMLEPFHIFRGSILSVSGYRALPYETFGVEYNQYEASARKYLPAGHRLAWANRLYYARTEGPAAPELYLDHLTGFFSNAPYRLRGYRRKEFSGHNLASASSELRYLLFPDIGWHLYFMFPDFNIYSMSAALFTDAGTCWDDGGEPDDPDMWGASWGFGLRLNLYIMQMAPFYINIDFAKPYGSDSWKTYWTFASSYITW
ncbi:MAG: hypothetical protein JXJ19_00355 [Elusimicrobia bacterium]|nr:hypothetical protein [Elusimicrobiota bacterium]